MITRGLLVAALVFCIACAEQAPDTAAKAGAPPEVTEQPSEVKVALLIHHPSRSQVLKAFLAEADAIMAWPIAESEMSPKLAALLPPVESEDPA